MLTLPKKNRPQKHQIDSTKTLTRCGPETYENKPGRLNGIGTLPSRSTQCVGIGLFGLRGPMHLCACVSEERSNGEGAGSQALSLLSDSIFWEHQSAYTATIQLNTVRSTAADIHWPRHPADRALCHQAGDVSMHRRISPALPAIRVAFAPERSCSHLHLHFFALHHANKTGAMSIPPSPYTAGAYHAAPASFYVHGVARTV